MGGEVLLLGSPMDAVTVLHYAESLADLPNKRTIRYRQPMLVDGKATWVQGTPFILQAICAVWRSRFSIKLCMLPH